MKSWKKQLKKEIAMHTPKLSEEVKNASIPLTIQRQENIKKKKGFKIYWALPATILTMLILFFSLWFSLKPTTPPSSSTHIYSLDINPSLIFTTDDKGNVISVSSLNEDADVILSRIDSLMNRPIAEAMTACVDASAKLGYFNLSTPGDAVLVRGLKDDTSSQLPEISKSIKNYFCKKGVYGVYIEEEISLSQFCENVGIPPTTQFIDFSNYIQGLDSKFGNRGVNEENLSSIYEDYVLGTQMLGLIQDFLKTNLDEIYENVTMLLKIFSLNTEIMTHKDNPSIFLKDYWSVDRFSSNNNYTDEFADLMMQMKEMLDEYESKFGICLQAIQDVSDLLGTYNDISLEDIKELGNLTLSDFLNAPEAYISILKSIGLDMTSIEEILIVPDSLEEYKNQMNQMLSIVSNRKESEFKEVYEELRSALDEVTYDKYLETIEKEYGSLMNYWNFSKK